MPNTQLKCPECERLGTIQILGHIDDQNRIVVRRYHNGVTYIEGENFKVSCQHHGPVYLKERKEDAGTNITYRQSWVSWEGTIFGTI